nr:MAG TPA: hypothetical protein [Microviridae sp.]
MEKKCLNKVCFGRGFRKVDPSISAVGFNPSFREKEIAVEIDPVSNFCIETTGEGEDKCYRYRSDISMLLHAKDTANKIGIEGLRYLSESRRTKTSAIQSQLDQMDDQLLLDTVKSRHLQSPSEILAWSQQLTAIAQDIEANVISKIREQNEQNEEELVKSIDASAAVSAAGSSTSAEE